MEGELGGVSCLVICLRKQFLLCFLDSYHTRVIYNNSIAHRKKIYGNNSHYINQFSMNLVPNHKCMSGLGREPLPHAQGPGFLPQHIFLLKRREKIKSM